VIENCTLLKKKQHYSCTFVIHIGALQAHIMTRQLLPHLSE
jgi:hypothetical protein